MDLACCLFLRLSAINWRASRRAQSQETTTTAKIDSYYHRYCACDASVGAAFSASAFASRL
jgi:hypothetical protein